MAEFAASNPRPRVGLKAWIETIPEFDEVVAGWKAGLHQATIRRWLASIHGEDVVPSASTIGHWLRDRHPRGEA